MHAFDILGDPVRRRILELLADGERSAGEVGALVQREFGISQPAVLDSQAGSAGDRSSRRRQEGPSRQMADMMTARTNVHRQIGSKQIGAGQAQSARLRATYDTSIEDVWKAWTEPNRLNRWFLQVHGDLRLGGTFQLEGNAGGIIQRCEPPRLLAVTWVFDDRPVDEGELRPSPNDTGGTTVELQHATVLTQVEWDGAMVDVLPDVGAGWEIPLAFALPAYLRGDLPDRPAAEWFEFTAEVQQPAADTSAAWARLLK